MGCKESDTAEQLTLSLSLCRAMDSMLSLLRAQVLSLVRELRSCKPHSHTHAHIQLPKKQTRKKEREQWGCVKETQKPV